MREPQLLYAARTNAPPCDDATMIAPESRNERSKRDSSDGSSRLRLPLPAGTTTWRFNAVAVRVASNADWTNSNGTHEPGPRYGTWIACTIRNTSPGSDC